MSRGALADVIVVGAGVIGLAAARELGRRGLRPLVIEAHAPGRGASWAAAGILSDLPPGSAAPEFAGLLAQGRAAYPGWCDALREESGVDPGLHRTGALLLEERGACTAVAGAEWLDAAGAAARVPGVAAPHGACWLPEVAQVRTPRLLRALEESLRHAGVAVETNTAVTGLLHGAGRIEGVSTASGPRRGPRVLLAAGVGSTALRPALRIEPVKGQILLFGAAPGQLPHLLIRGHTYLVPRADGRVLLGSTLEPGVRDWRPTADARARLRADGEALWPPLAQLPLLAQWTGLRPVAPREPPVITADPELAGLYHATGHARLGIALAPATAARIAELMA